MDFALQRRLVIWLTSHIRGNVFIARGELSSLRSELRLDISAKLWSQLVCGVSSVNCSEVIGIDVVRTLLSHVGICFADLEWSGFLHQARKLTVIEVSEDEEPAPNQHVGAVVEHQPAVCEASLSISNIIEYCWQQPSVTTTISFLSLPLSLLLRQTEAHK